MKEAQCASILGFFSPNGFFPASPESFRLTPPPLLMKERSPLPLPWVPSDVPNGFLDDRLGGA